MDGSGQPASAARERDNDIVALLADGRVESAFELLLGRYERKVYRLCLGLLRDPELAADAAQETLVRIWRALGRFDARASLSTWIYTIARNRALSAIERRRDHDSLDDEPIAAAAELRLQEQAQGGAGQVNESRAGLLREFVSTLPERYRRPLVLYYFEECSVEEVATMLAVGENTVKTWIHRARALLMERIASAGLGEATQWLEDAV